jgi:dTDP-4-dehydrorhamnose 3,5-epimerase
LDSVIGTEPAGISGVEWRPLRVFADDRGAVLHMVRADAPGFSGFGEVYFSELRPGVTKGWKLHLRMTQRLAVPVGRIRFVLFDARPDSPTTGRIMTCISGRPDRYGLLIIPPGIWYGFENLSEGPALLANCADLIHDPAESRILPLDTPEIPFDWKGARS